MHLALIVNTASADVLEQLRAAVRTLRTAGHTVRPRTTFEGGDARTFAREAAEAGADVVIAAGGDGTINEVANGIFDWLDERPDPTRAPLPRLAVVPLGTANDLAAGLGIPQDVETAMAVAVAGIPHPMDVARVNGRCFLNVSTGGFGAESTTGASKELKNALGPLAYVVTGLQKFVEMESRQARFTADGEVLFDGAFLVFAVGNARRTGGGNWLTPEADISDGLLDVMIVKEMTHAEFVRLAPLLRAGKHAGHEAVTYRKVRSVRVEVDGELAVNVDGEPVPGDSFAYDVAPRRITMMLAAPLDG